MASAMILKKPSSMVSVASRRTLAMLTSVIQGLHHHHNSAPLPVKEETIKGSGNFCSEGRGFPFYGVGACTRNFHARSSPLDFKASIASPAGFAVANYSEEEKSKSDDGLEISKLEIDRDIISALAGRGITKLFPIQRAVLEPAMQGSDMIGRAKTGTGKTLAFGIPIMDKILRYNAKHGCGRNPLALVLAPTRELARQVEKEFNISAKKLDTLCLYGGTPIGRQMSALDRGVDVVVGTPGRVIDLMKRGALDLSEVQFLVLDEADQMLNVGFEEDVEVILEKLPRERQSMMFSATMPNWIVKITRKYLKNPLTIDLVGDSDQKLAEGISLYSTVTDFKSKAAIIGPLVTEHAKGGKCIVFTQTKRDADRLAYMMARSYRCEALHGDISQSQRERTLEGFREGRFNILVATDVAARGLDIPNVDLVIHYELPSTSEIFVHRSGRTGRAGKKGTAIIIHTYDQARAVKMIERDVGSKFVELPPIAIDPSQREMFEDMGSGGRFGSFGFGNTRGGSGRSNFRSSGQSSSSSFSRFGGGGGGYNEPSYGGSKFGRSGGFGESGSGRSDGGYGKFGPNRTNQGYGRSDGGFGNFGPNRSNQGYGRSDGGFGNFGPNRTNPGYGRSGSSDRSTGFGTFGTGRPRRFGDFSLSQRNGAFNSHVW